MSSVPARTGASSGRVLVPMAAVHPALRALHGAVA